MADPLRLAASVIAGRDGERGLELLVLERGPEHRFLPGYVAFPGGAVDENDASLAERWFGDRDHSLRAAAVREFAEELGLALTSRGLVGAAGPDAIRQVDDDPPPPDALVEIAHWVAPAQVPVRFDARYYAVVSPEDLEPTPDGREAAHAWWAEPTRILEGWRSGRRKLFWPTYYTLRKLSECASAKELLELRIHTREPDDSELRSLPRSTFWQD